MADFCVDNTQQVEFDEKVVCGLWQCEALRASQKREAHAVNQLVEVKCEIDELLDLRTYVHSGRACRFTYALYLDWVYIYRENPDMRRHIFTFRRWFDSSMPFAVREG